MLSFFMHSPESARPTTRLFRLLPLVPVLAAVAASTAVALALVTHSPRSAPNTAAFARHIAVRSRDAILAAGSFRFVWSARYVMDPAHPHHGLIFRENFTGAYSAAWPGRLRASGTAFSTRGSALVGHRQKARILNWGAGEDTKFGREPWTCYDGTPGRVRALGLWNPAASNRAGV